MKRFVHTQNLRRYERMLLDETDPDRRRRIETLLEEERRLGADGGLSRDSGTRDDRLAAKPPPDPTEA